MFGSDANMYGMLDLVHIIYVNSRFYYLSSCHVCWLGHLTGMCICFIKIASSVSLMIVL